MVYGIIMLLNFAHGDIIMIGAYIAWLCMARFALNPVFAVVFAVIGCVLLGVTIEKVAYKPLRNSPRISLLITAIGISFLLENAAQMIFGAGAQVIPPFFSEDTGAAELMGININRTISFTFAIGSALAGIGSVLYCTAYPQAYATMGSMLGLKAFVAAVLGGIGSIPGAMIGGFAIGLAEALVSAAGLSVWKDGVVFAILIIVLLIKPTGILGRSMAEKV